MVSATMAKGAGRFQGSVLPEFVPAHRAGKLRVSDAAASDAAWMLCRHSYVVVQELEPVDARKQDEW